MKTSLMFTTATSLLLGACASAPPSPPKAVTAVSAAQAGTVGGFAANCQHGIHVHEKGDCSAVDASSAGGHFNPAATVHGRAGSGAHHAGDMDNLTADSQGVARVDIHLQGVTLGGGAANDIAGRALVVHLAPDDYRSQPAGNSGARVACGIITVVP